MKNHARDDGFTLVELLVCVTILTVIMPAIGMAILAGLKGSGQNGTRLAESHSAQQATALFSADVMSATSFQTGVTSCGPSALIAMAWNDPTFAGGVLDPSAGAKSVTYAVATTAAGETQLKRYSCTSSGQVVAVVAHNLLTATVSCDVSPCSSATLAKTVNLVVKVSGAATDKLSTTVPDYTFTLSATRRSLQ